MASQPTANNKPREDQDADAYLVDHYDRLGDQSNDFRNLNMVAMLGDLVEGPDVLDIGCGTGTLLGHLSREGGLGRLVGVEPS
ncbi:MAG: hypothetical protein R3236_10805, partial [Phycisphaeraceae bacterium]|nr:hypothetical protein [Phycisphaeraceae bacterium]